MSVIFCEMLKILTKAERLSSYSHHPPELAGRAGEQKIRRETKKRPSHNFFLIWVDNWQNTFIISFLSLWGSYCRCASVSITKETYPSIKVNEKNLMHSRSWFTLAPSPGLQGTLHNIKQFVSENLHEFSETFRFIWFLYD